jgi:uncharacterized membrane protein YsdA (DUF1294 family)/cold shock CspA family protein
MKFQGTLTRWNDGRGFGFIQPNGGGQDVFVNIKAFARGRGRPADGARLVFAVETGPDGRKRATAVDYAPAPQSRARPKTPTPTKSSPPWPVLSVIAFCAFPVVYAFATWRWGVSAWVLAAYALLSAVTFLVYGIDKSAAARQAWRVPEAHLHLLAFAGGWPGATLAQQWLRHKSKKAEFRFVHWVVVLANLVTLVVLASKGALLGWPV